MIMSLLLKGRSYREVVAAAGCSHRDVSAARTAMTVHEITAERLGVMSEDDLAGLFPDGRSRVSAEYEQPDFARVARSMRANRHFTLLQAWRAYAAGTSPLRRYGYAQYCHLFGEYAVRNDLVAVLHHEPGRAMLVDWAGDTIALADAVTGEVSRAYLFLAVLPFSGYVFCRAFTDMRMEAWIAAHVAAFEFIGGAVQILVPDNAATATHRKARGDAARFVTDRYRLMADHYGVAVVPARVRKPRDKPRVSYCTSSERSAGRWRSCRSQGVVPASLVEGWRVGSGRLVEDFAFVVIPLPADNSGVVPVFDGGGRHAEQCGHLAERDQAGVGQPLAAAA